jgi:hypothetical protein
MKAQSLTDSALLGNPLSALSERFHILILLYSTISAPYQTCRSVHDFLRNKGIGALRLVTHKVMGAFPIRSSTCITKLSKGPYVWSSDYPALLHPRTSPFMICALIMAKIVSLHRELRVCGQHSSLVLRLRIQQSTCLLWKSARAGSRLKHWSSSSRAVAMFWPLKSRYGTKVIGSHISEVPLPW